MRWMVVDRVCVYRMWLEKVLILMNNSSSAELQRSSNICASAGFPVYDHRSDRAARRRTALIRCSVGLSVDGGRKAPPRRGGVNELGDNDRTEHLTPRCSERAQYADRVHGPHTHADDVIHVRSDRVCR